MDQQTMADRPNVTVAQLAQILDLDPRRIQQLAGEGVVVRVASGRYDLLGSVRGYVRYLRDRSMRSDVSSESFTAQRARLVKSKADAAEFEARRLSGELIPVGDVLAVVGEIHGAVKTKLRGVGAKVASLLEGMNATERKAVVDQAIEECLEDLAKAEVQFDPPPVAGNGGGAPPGDALAAPVAAATEADGEPVG